MPKPFFKLQGKFKVDQSDLGRGSSARLTDEQKDTIDHVLEYYAPKDSQWLSDLTPIETPWVQARVGLYPGEQGSREISLVGHLLWMWA